MKPLEHFEVIARLEVRRSGWLLSESQGIVSSFGIGLVNRSFELGGEGGGVSNIQFSDKMSVWHETS